jgi:hypothetical protein
MSDPAPIVEESDLILARLAKLDLASMEHVHLCLTDTTRPEEVARLAHAQARLSRACRQDLACLAKLRADREKAARERPAPEPASDPRKSDPDIAAELRADQLMGAVGRIIAHAAAGDRTRHIELAHRFDRELDDWYEDDDFILDGFDDQVLRACRALDLTPELAARWRDLPEPAFHPDPEVRPDAGADDDAGPWPPSQRPRAARAPTPRTPWPNTG